VSVYRPTGRPSSALIPRRSRQSTARAPFYGHHAVQPGKDPLELCRSTETLLRTPTPRGDVLPRPRARPDDKGAAFHCSGTACGCTLNANGRSDPAVQPQLINEGDRGFGSPYSAAAIESNRDRIAPATWRRESPTFISSELHLRPPTVPSAVTGHGAESRRGGAVSLHNTGQNKPTSTCTPACYGRCRCPTRPRPTRAGIKRRQKSTQSHDGRQPGSKE